MLTRNGRSSTRNVEREIVRHWEQSQLCCPCCEVPKHDSEVAFGMNRKSADTPLGVPFNIASYALLLLMVANELNYHPMEVIHTLGDTHVYANQLEGVDEQLSRTPTQLPTVRLKCPVGTSIFDITWEDIELLNYNPQPKISFEISV